MGTKNKPGAWDCYANAEDDEPMFVLLARDPMAPLLVTLWATMREIRGGCDPKKIAEARECASAMAMWFVMKKGVDGARAILVATEIFEQACSTLAGAAGLLKKSLGL